MSKINYKDYDIEFYNFLRAHNPFYKVEIIRINISSTFMMRARCRTCNGLPNYYYQVRNPFLYKDPYVQIKGSQWLRSLVKRMTSNWYLKYAPKDFLNINGFSFVLDGKHYSPTLHRIRNSDSYSYKDNIIEFVGCSCGTTIWAFNQKANKDRPEVVNRKGRYSYSPKFKY